MSVDIKQLIEAANPKRGPQYSPNLYKWAKRNTKYFFPTLQAFHLSELPGRVQLGQMSERPFGSDLWDILTRKGRVYSFGGTVIALPDLLTSYLSIGRCAFDPSHNRTFMGDKSRWMLDGDLRHCLWCNNHTQRLVHWVEITPQQYWSAA